MKTIIAGSRDFTDPLVLARGINDSGLQITEVVSGGCRGVDRLGEEWAEAQSIPVKVFPADWSMGKKAGPLRNRQMAEYADALVAIWDGKSRGTENMIETMRKQDKPVFVIRV